MADDLQAVLADAARAGLTSDAELEAVARQWEQRAQQPQAAINALNPMAAGVSSLVNAWRKAGPQRVVGGLQKMASGPAMDDRFGGASDVVRGGLMTAAPMLAPVAIPAALGAPGATVGALGLGALGTKAAGWMADKAHLGPGATALAEDAGGMAGAGLGRYAPEAAAAAKPVAQAAARGTASALENPIVSGTLGAIPGLASRDPVRALEGGLLGSMSGRRIAAGLRKIAGPSAETAAAPVAAEAAAPELSMANRPGAEAVALGQKAILTPDEMQQYLAFARRMFPGKSEAELLRLSPAQLTGMFHAGGAGR